MGKGKDSLVGTVLGERYQLVCFLARGGMGEVYEAHDHKRQQRLAIKLLRQELNADPEWCARFERECKIAASIDSPHVARVLKAGEMRTGRRWIAYEFLEGESLDVRFARTGRLPFTEVAWMVEHALLGLRAAHQLGVIHRDVKPGNLFLLAGGSKLVVLDFGIAKRFGPGRKSSSLTSTGAMLGTPSYMSPEQLVNPKGVDLRTDLYSVGLVAYRLLSERLPFQHRDFGAMLHNKLEGRLPPLASASGTTWPDLMDGWMEHMVAARREHRFASADAALQGWQVVSEAMRTYVPRSVPVEAAFEEAEADMSTITGYDTEDGVTDP
jgi:serine/threonine-protein kinase